MNAFVGEIRSPAHIAPHPTPPHPTHPGPNQRSWRAGPFARRFFRRRSVRLSFQLVAMRSPNRRLEYRNFPGRRHYATCSFALNFFVQTSDARN